LPGTTPVEQDLALASELRARDLRVFTGRLDTREAALAAFDEFARLDLRRLPLGIELPRWTFDPFHGPLHQSWNDWATPLDFTAKAAALASFYAASDRYLQDPSNANHFEVERLAVGQLGGAQGGLYNDWFKNASRAKRRALLLGAHLFRLALGRKPGWFELPLVPFPELRVTYNPFALIGGATQEFACSKSGGSFGGGTCPQLCATFAPEQRPKFGGPEEAKINPRLEELTHTWWTLAILFDQPMLGSEDNAIDGSYFYWQFRFPQKDVHLPLLFAHIAAARVHYDETMRGRPEYPLANWHKYKTSAVLSTLNYGPLGGGARRGGPLVLDVQGSPASASHGDGVRLRVKLIRAFAWKQLDALVAGKGVEIKDAVRDYYLGQSVNGLRRRGRVRQQPRQEARRLCLCRALPRARARSRLPDDGTLGPGQAGHGEGRGRPRGVPGLQVLTPVRRPQPATAAGASRARSAGNSSSSTIQPRQRVVPQRQGSATSSENA
jgi:hypothetical protein